MGHDPAKDFNDRLIAFMNAAPAPTKKVNVRSSEPADEPSAEA
jgi:hypothetical protein